MFVSPAGSVRGVFINMLPMEQQLPNALERIENPILIILLVVLLLASGGLWFAYRALQQRLMEALLQMVAAVTNLNATLADIKERLEEIENRLTSQKK